MIDRPDLKGIDWLTMEETADLLKVSTMTISRWLKRGKLRGHKMGGVWRIDPRDYVNFLNSTANIQVSSRGEDDR